jgi:putative oxidoreductase
MNTTRLAPVTHALLRVVAGLLISQHGMQKLFGAFGGFGSPGGTAPITSVMGIIGILECFGGLAVMLGLFTRPIAFLLSGEMAYAYFTAHQPHGTWPIQNHGETAVLLCFIFLFLFANGAGGWSLDSRMRRSRGV